MSLHEVPVSTGDIIFVPAGTVHAIGKGVLLYELQEYSDLTYRLYDYGRLSSAGIPRELHIERSLDVMHFDKSRHTKMQAVLLQNGDSFTNRCLAACQYFVTCELILHKTSVINDYMKNKTHDSCIILTSLSGEISVRYGETLDYAEKLFKGQTMILPSELGIFCLAGSGTLLYSYVPASEDEIWHEWEAKNGL